MNWKAAWAAITSKPVRLAIGAAALVWLGLEWGDHREKNAVITAPVTLQTVQRARDWPVAPLPECPAIAEIKPPAKERKRLEQRFGVDLSPAVVAENATVQEAQKFTESEQPRDVNGAPMFPLASPALVAETRILAYKTVPKAPHGGEVLATLKPGDPQIALDFRANPRPFIETKADYGMGVEGGVTGDGQRWRAYGFVEPLRVGRFTLRALGGGEMRDGETGWFVGAALEFRP